MKEYKRLTNNNLEEYDFCVGCKYFGEPNGCNRWNGACGNYERFNEMYNRLEELEDKIENGTLVELPYKARDRATAIIDTLAYDNSIEKVKIKGLAYIVEDEKWRYNFSAYQQNIS